LLKGSKNIVMRKNHRVSREVVEGVLKKVAIAGWGWEGSAVDVTVYHRRPGGVHKEGVGVLRADEADGAVHVKEKEGSQT
jgi:hypothetical protein